jgi:hypothetical protein
LGTAVVGAAATLVATPATEVAAGVDVGVACPLEELQAPSSSAAPTISKSPRRGRWRVLGAWANGSRVDIVTSEVLVPDMR